MKLSHAAVVTALGIAGMQAGCRADGKLQEANPAVHIQDAQPVAQVIQSAPKTTAPNESTTEIAMSAAHYRGLLERIGGTCKYPDK